jgi:hypothetical protein
VACSCFSMRLPCAAQNRSTSAADSSFSLR